MAVSDLTGGWDYSTLPANVRLGQGCYLEDRALFTRFRSTRDPGLVIGDGVRAYTWTRFTVEAEGQLTIGDDCVLVGAVFWCAERIILGRRVVVSYQVMIADSDFHPRDPDLRRQDARALAPGGDLTGRPPVTGKPVVIEDDAWIGVGAIILKGVHIGAGARIGAGAVVSAHVPAGAAVAGNPARVVPAEAVGP
jgi:acetyltransferase-like isoleucine patch superfamily enzyme